MDFKALIQSENYQAFYDRYKFTMTVSKPHPSHKDIMKFEGLEADYVQSLEREIAEMRKYISLLNDRIQFLTDREFHAWKEGRRKNKGENEN